MLVAKQINSRRYCRNTLWSGNKKVYHSKGFQIIQDAAHKSPGKFCFKILFKNMESNMVSICALCNDNIFSSREGHP